MTAWVKSVEYSNFNAASTAATTVALTKGQVPGNCIPFQTARSTTGNAADLDNQFRYHQVQYTSGPNVVATRGGTGSTARELGIFTLEVDPAQVKVQQLDFTISSGSASTTVSPSSVTTTRTFLVVTWRVNADTNDLFDNALVRGVLTDATTVTLDRAGTTASISGTVYVIEALSDSVFTVQTVDISSSSASATGTVSAVDTTRSFVFGSHKSTEPADDIDEGGIIYGLTNSTTVTAEKTTTSATMTIRAVVVQCAADSIASLQRGKFSYNATSATAALSPSVDLTKSIVLSSGAQGYPTLNNTSGTGAGRAQALTDLQDASTVRTRITTNPSGTQAAYWQVIDFVLSAATTGTITASLTALAQKQDILATTSLTAAGQTSFDIQASLNAAAQKLFTMITDLDAVAKKNLTASSSLEVAGLDSLSNIATLDSLAQLARDIQSSLEALGIMSASVQAVLDTVAKSSLSVNLILDAAAQILAETIQLTLDSTAQKTFIESNTLDAAANKVLIVSAVLEAAAKSSLLSTSDLDAVGIIPGANEIIFSLDALSQILKVAASDFDAVSQIFRTIVSNLDAAAQKQLSIACLFEALSLAQITIQSQLDSVAKDTFQILSELDAVGIVPGGFQILITLDALAKDTLQLISTLNAAGSETLDISTVLNAVSQTSFSVISNLTAAARISGSISSALDAAARVVRTMETSFSAVGQSFAATEIFAIFDVTGLDTKSLSSSFEARGILINTISSTLDAVALKMANVQSVFDVAAKDTFIISSALDALARDTKSVQSTLEARAILQGFISFNLDSAGQRSGLTSSALLDAISGALIPSNLIEPAYGGPLRLGDGATGATKTARVRLN